jgi:hypothetical protein
MAMICPVCQSEGPEGKKHCSECGAHLPQPEQVPEEQPIVAVSTAPKPDWLLAHWKGLVAVVIVLVVVLASVGLIYTQPLSKIKVLLYYGSENEDQLQVAVYIDGEEKARGYVSPGYGGILGVWSVAAGYHTVAIDYLYPNYPSGDSLGDDMKWSYTYQVGPLYTKNVYIYL